MSSGQILVAQSNGVNVIRLIGDVRLTLCVSFDQFISNMFSQEDFRAVVFDLRNVDGIDSTTLGLMAKISIGARERGVEQPVVVTGSASIRRLLVSMGFDDIFELVSDQEVPLEGAAVLPEKVDDELKIQEKVLEAHRVLMNLNRPNEVKFRELVETLEGRC